MRGRSDSRICPFRAFGIEWTFTSAPVTSSKVAILTTSTSKVKSRDLARFYARLEEWEYPVLIINVLLNSFIPFSHMEQRLQVADSQAKLIKSDI